MKPTTWRRWGVRQAAIAPTQVHLLGPFVHDEGGGRLSVYLSTAFEGHLPRSCSVGRRSERPRREPCDRRTRDELLVVSDSGDLDVASHLQTLKWRLSHVATS